MSADEPDDYTVEIVIRDKATGDLRARIEGIAASERHISWETEYDPPPEDLYDLNTNYRTGLHPRRVQCLHLRVFAPKPLDGVICTVHDLRPVDAR